MKAAAGRQSERSAITRKQAVLWWQTADRQAVESAVGIPFPYQDKVACALLYIYNRYRLALIVS